MLPEHTRQAAILMRDELEWARLSVSLAPGRGGGKIRVVDGHNASWYKTFCRDFPAGRSKPRHRKKPDTLIKRRHTIRALGEIERGIAVTLYAHRLLPYIEKYWRELSGESDKISFFENLAIPIPWHTQGANT